MGARHWFALIVAYIITVIPHTIVAFFRAPFALWAALYDSTRAECHKESMQRVFVLKPMSGEPLEIPKDWKN